MNVLVAGDVTDSIFAASVQPFDGEFGTADDLLLPQGQITAKVEGMIDNTAATPAVARIGLLRPERRARDRPRHPAERPRAPVRRPAEARPPAGDRQHLRTREPAGHRTAGQAASVPRGPRSTSTRDRQGLSEVGRPRRAPRGPERPSPPRPKGRAAEAVHREARTAFSAMSRRYQAPLKRMARAAS